MPTNVNWPTINVVRKSTSADGTVSDVYIEKDGEQVKLHGIEQPWRDNKPFKSCIPSGMYTLLPWESEKFGDCYVFVGGEVSLYEGNGSRYACLIHSANYAHQLQGCLAVGLSEGVSEDGKPAVWNSKKAVQKLQDVVGEGPAQVNIRWID